MWTALVLTSVAAGTYAPAGDLAQLTAIVGRAEHGCYAVAPEARFEVTGPADASLVLLVDLPKKPARPAALKVVISIDEKGRATSLKPRRVTKARYAEVAGREPSAAASPIKLAVTAGTHSLVVTFPAGRSGCVELRGLTRVDGAAPSSPSLEVLSPGSAASAAPPVVAAQPDLAALPARAVDAPAPPPAPAVEGQGAKRPTPDGETGASSPAYERIVAQPAETTLDAERAEGAPASDGDDARLGLFAGGVLPRADLRASFTVGLLFELPLASVGAPSRFDLNGWGVDLAADLAVGWSPLRQQDDVLIAGRGQTRLAQESLTLPMALGVTLRADAGWPFRPHVGVALAVDVTHTELRAFSVEPIVENDVGVGIAARAGGHLPLGPGGVLIELTYREVGADLGALESVAEPSFASAALRLGYLVAF